MWFYLPLTQTFTYGKEKKLLPDWRALNSILIYPPEWLCNFLKHSVQSPVWKSEVGLSFKSFDTPVWSTFSLNEKTHTENVAYIKSMQNPKMNLILWQISKRWSVISAGIHRRRKEGNLLHFSQTAHTATHLLFLKIKIQFGQKLGSIFNAFLLAVCLRLPFVSKWHFTSVIVTSTQRPAA